MRGHPPRAALALPPADLRDPAAWTLSPGVGNPASLYSNEMREMFDAAFRGDAEVRGRVLAIAGRGQGAGACQPAGQGLRAACGTGLWAAAAVVLVAVSPAQLAEALPPAAACAAGAQVDHRI